MAKNSNFWKRLGSSVQKNAPELLLAAGLIGFVTTVVLAVEETPKAMQLLEEAKRKRASEEPEKERSEVIREHVEDYAKIIYKCYIPAMICGVSAIICLICAHNANLRRNAALAAACSLSETALKEYRAKVAETVGEQKEQEIRDAVNKDRLAANPVSTKEVYICGGETLCYDHWSGRYFKADPDKLRRAANEVSRRMLDEIYISMNDFYDEVGLSAVKIGDELGWNVNRTGLVDIRLGAQLAEGDIPCIVLDYVNAPVHDYMR